MRRVKASGATVLTDTDISGLKKSGDSISGVMAGGKEIPCDIVVLAADADAAAHALERISQWMEGAGLTLHPEKTRIVDMSDADAYFDFLGYRFKRSRKGKMLRLVRPKSKQLLRAKLRRPTRRSNGRSIEAVIALINPVLKGWFGYFKQAHRTTFRDVDGFVRRRLRAVLRKREKRPGFGRTPSDHRRWPLALH